MQNVTATPGWTTDWEQMGGDYEWASNGVGVEMAQRLGLGSPTKPIMSALPQSGEIMHLFESGSGKYYLWNPIEGGVWQVTKPASLSDIVAAIAKDGLRSIETQRIGGSE